MNKEQLIDNICDLVNKRNNEEFHINSEVATKMISDYIDEHIKFVLNNFKAEVLTIIENGTSRRSHSYKNWEQKIVDMCEES